MTNGMKSRSNSMSVSAAPSSPTYGGGMARVSLTVTTPGVSISESGKFDRDGEVSNNPA